MSVADNFEPVSVFGQVTLMGRDGRTLVVDIHEIPLDTRSAESPVTLDVGYEDPSFGPLKTSRLIDSLTVRMRLHLNQPEALFTATYSYPPGYLPDDCTECRKAGKACGR